MVTLGKAYFVTRHSGSREWAVRHGIKAEMVADFVTSAKQDVPHPIWGGSDHWTH